MHSGISFLFLYSFCHYDALIAQQNWKSFSNTKGCRSLSYWKSKCFKVKEEIKALGKSLKQVENRCKINKGLLLNSSGKDGAKVFHLTRTLPF